MSWQQNRIFLCRIFASRADQNFFLLQDIQKKILENNFFVIRTKKTTISTKQAHDFYDEHRNKFFFNRLVTFMCSGPSYLHILARENAIQLWRNMMGPTKVFKTVHSHPDTIRGLYGLSDTRNATHGSGNHFIHLMLATSSLQLSIFFQPVKLK